MNKPSGVQNDIPVTYSKSFWKVCVLFLVTSAKTSQKLCTEIIILIAHIPKRQRPRFFETIKSSFFSRCFPLISQTLDKKLGRYETFVDKCGPEIVKTHNHTKKFERSPRPLSVDVKNYQLLSGSHFTKKSSSRFPAHLQEKNL